MREEPVKIGDWILTFILLWIPVVNLIMLIFWACDSSSKPSKRNFAIANLIFGIPIVVLLVGGMLLAMAVPAFNKVREQAQEKALQNAERAAFEQSSDQSVDQSFEQAGEQPAEQNDGQQYRTFATRDGGFIHAKVLSLSDDRVRLKRADGLIFEEPLANFSDEDMEYIVALHYSSGE